jgi:putative spermidine/putrescine transport system substrate-binding protein
MSAPALAGRLSRRRFVGVGAAGLAVGLSGCGRSEALDPGPDVPTPDRPTAAPAPVTGYGDAQRWAGRTLRVGAWGGDIQAALREAAWGPFAVATGCAVEEVLTDRARLAESQAAGDAYADALLVDAAWAQNAAAGDALTPLPQELVGPQTLDLVEPTEWGLPAFAYAAVNAYRRDAAGSLAGVPRTWQEWWDRARFPGDRTLRKDPLSTFEFALLADGVAPADLYPLDGERAIASLRTISGRIIDRWWETGAQAVGWLSRNRADYGSAWSYRVAAAQADGLPVELVWEHGLLLADHWIVPAGSANAEVAMDFLRFATTPEVQAALARRAGLGPVTSEAFGLLDPLLVATLPTAPANLPQLIRRDVAWWAENEVVASQLFNTWLLGTPDA